MTRPPRPDDQARLRRLRDLPLTYPDVGATARDRLPDGYRTLERSIALGTGEQVFERAAGALMSWQMHRRAGLTVLSTAPTASPGECVLLMIGRRPLVLTAPCRVLRAIDDEGEQVDGDQAGGSRAGAERTAGERRQGFAYGTLPGHPESGEESFLVSLSSAGAVTFTVRAFSRPATTLARIGGPFTRLAQDLATRRYLHTLRHLAAS